ncbi:arginine--tRNA ligase [Salinibacterium sp. NSLL150]|uniref:arginine--tRNA ligase n=1 Tax=unclassified Salinibacterium TaxID=2632331 RepID=UPI0018CC8D13|nr:MULTISPECIES: arginine--tRNA ligase [unclassified Salinibacterium]MBH0100206.1 arginine--tRNA ligase [Salinibacterium sp. NSLL35]MBH0102960.1 arginine--tRNA ligase [Salinibacterium sp. NSLL150]MBH0105720.1 arginine--tRNA ligase [Salinibacterium sp. NSLL16]MBH0108480.1 arginine--tRNA ligase [Salinibacterium sp. NSLL17]
MNPADLSATLLSVVSRIAADRGTPDLGLTVSDLVLERPRNRDHGDWASNIAMKLAKPLGANPRELAIEIAEQARAIDGIASVDVAGPGFINITLDAAAAGALAKTIVEQGEAYGRNDSLAGQTINLEFVSANPTGPLHIGHTRWAALGDSLARVLKSAGAELVSEFYINDAGNQMDNFGASILASAKGEPTPENGYPGAYVAELAQRVLASNPEILELDHDEAIAVARERGYELQLGEIKKSLAAFNVHFDVWFSERDLHAVKDDGKSAIDTAVERLRAQGHVADSDDAVWVKTTDFGDDKDRVIKRGNGIYTYFAADAAYYLSKGDRGYAHKIYLLGADHHGYVHRLKALAGAAGDDPNKDIEVLIGQLVSINGARLSKRAGNIIELDDLREWLGTDALRYSLARYPADSPLTLDPEILQKRTNDNPVFYVQYAHARTHSVARNAGESGVDRSVFDASLLTNETESILLGVLAEFPRIVAQAAELREPHRIARFAEELAGSYHRWYDQCRVTPMNDEEVTDVHRTRLWVNDAVGQVLRNSLWMLGVSAPERM